MLVAIISDTHNNVFRLQKAIEEISKRNISLVFHCGDIGNEMVINELKNMDAQIYMVCGNNDYFFYLDKICKNIKNIKIFEDAGEIEIDNKKIAITHTPQMADMLASIKKYNIIFYGHTHKRMERFVQKIKLVNPGDIEARYNNPSFAIYNTLNDNIEFIDL